MAHPKPESHTAPQRITTIVRNYWEYLRGERSFPSENDINSHALGDVWDNCFLVHVGDSLSPGDYQYQYLGENIVIAYGEDLTGLRVDSMVAPEAAHLKEEYEKVLLTRRPIFDEGEISLDNGTRMIKYRQILLPLGEKDGSIHAILGGMSYKIFDA